MPGYRVNTDQSGDYSATNVTSDEAIISFFSQTGIGRAEVAVVDGSWPKSVKLRLYLGGLENLRIEGDKSVIKISMPSSSPGRVLQSVQMKAVSSQSWEKLDARQALYMRTTLEQNIEPPESKFPLPRQYFEVTLSSAFLADCGEQFSIHWVDFYR